MNNLIRQWNGRIIRQRQDGYFSATDMCQACDKFFANWNKLDSTKEYLKALEQRRYSDNNNGKFVDIIQGGIPEQQGTWVYRKVAIRLAQWLSAEFAVQVDEWIEELLTNGSLAIANIKAIEKTPAQIAEQVIAETETVLNWTIQTLGLDETIGKLMKVDMVADLLPHLKPSLEPVKQHLSAADPIEAVGMTATQLGEHLNPKKKAKEVNTLLEQIGLQYKMYRTSTKSGKQKYSWQVTEEGQKHSTVHKVTNGNSDWNGNQIKWQMSAVQLVQDYLDNGTV
ncbi:MAG: KilA-N domain-containing protein [Symploca sp. SIO1B1]|nr:KilA-N domain-containing protein [Symploca sp. SIO1B1]